MSESPSFLPREYVQVGANLRQQSLQGRLVPRENAVERQAQVVVVADRRPRSKGRKAARHVTRKKPAEFGKLCGRKFT